MSGELRGVGASRRKQSNFLYFRKHHPGFSPLLTLGNVLPVVTIRSKLKNPTLSREARSIAGRQPLGHVPVYSSMIGGRESKREAIKSFYVCRAREKQS